MRVVIKAENIDDYPFEVKAMKNGKIVRKRHFNPAKMLTNEQIETAPAEQGRVKAAAAAVETPAQPATEGAGRPVVRESAPAAVKAEGKGVPMSQLRQAQ